jgi:hypothetical protein
MDLPTYVSIEIIQNAAEISKPPNNVNPDGRFPHLDRPPKRLYLFDNYEVI